MLKTQTGVAKSPVNDCRQLYDRYGAMLFGFLLEAVGDRNLAEMYLIDIFADLAKEQAADNYTWLQLRRFAKDKINAIYPSQNKPFGLASERLADHKSSGMTAEQHYVFFNLYKCGRPVAVVAREMDLPQVRVCKILAEAFTLVRK